MRGRGEQPVRQRLWSRSRSSRTRAGNTGAGAPTGVFSAVGAEPRSSWTEPGDAVIPNPSVDPSTRSWVDPDAVPGVLGPPQANPTRHADLPEKAPSNFADAIRAVDAEPRVAMGASSTGLLNRLGIDGQTGPIDLARDPRTRLIGALVAVVIAVLLLGRLGDLVSPSTPSGPKMGVGAEVASPGMQPQPDVVTPDPGATPPAPLATGGDAPQLVVVGIGGGLSAERVRRFTNAAEQTGARFTFFASVTDLLGPVGIDRYLPPGSGQAPAPAPVAEIDDEARRRVGGLLDALVAGGQAGHEVAAGLGPSGCVGADGDSWTAGDWSSELGQLRSVAAHPNDYNAWSDDLGDLFADGLRGAAPGCAPDFDVSRGAGPSALASAAVEADLEWIVGGPAPGGAAAPAQTLGLLRFSPVVDTSSADPTDTGGGSIEAALTDHLQAAITGDRPPLVVNVADGGAHPDSGDEAVLSFVQDACGRSDVRCVTFSEAARMHDAEGPQAPG